MRRIVLILMGISIAFASAGTALAGTATATLPVSATSPPICSIESSPAAITFGDYDSAGVNGSTYMIVICNDALSYRIAFNAGTHFASGTRNMLDPNSTTPEAYPIGYRLYRDPTRVQELGDTGYGDTYPGMIAGNTGNGMLQQTFIYATALPGYNVHAGTYSDTVTMTVNY